MLFFHYISFFFSQNLMLNYTRMFTFNFLNVKNILMIHNVKIIYTIVILYILVIDSCIGAFLPSCLLLSETCSSWRTALRCLFCPITHRPSRVSPPSELSGDAHKHTHRCLMLQQHWDDGRTLTGLSFVSGMSRSLRRNCWNTQMLIISPPSSWRQPIAGWRFAW